MIKISIRKKSFYVTENNLVFWDKFRNKTWEQDTFNIFDGFLDHDTVYFDIGAWIGPTVLYAGQLSKIAYAFEPDPVAFSELNSNLELNSGAEWHNRIMIINKAAGVEDGVVSIGSRSGGGDSLSSILFSENGTSWKVDSVSIPGFIRDNELEGEKMFFKIDIEGGEYPIIKVLNNVLSTYNAILFLSLHPGNLFDSMVRSNPGLFNRIKQWIRLQFIHIGIINSLPFRFVYLQSGKRISLFSMLYYTLRLRSFSVISSDQRWKL